MARQINIEEDRDMALREGVSVLAFGHPVAIPTETVYGLAADATNPVAIARIYETKGRPQFNPLICHMASVAMAEEHVTFDPLSRRLADAFWPGPLTLILPLKAESPIHSLATAGLDTAGVRIPEGFAAELINAFGKPLAAPSANSSGKISSTSAAHVEADLGDRIELILDGGASPVGVESTIVKIEADGTARLLRPGGIVAEDIERVIGVPLMRPEKASAAIEAPGMLASHYAPAAAVRLNAVSLEAGEALLRFGDADISGQENAAVIIELSRSGDLVEAASRLFDAMKTADASGAHSVAITPIPHHGLGEAINDRLARAAAPRP